MLVLGAGTGLLGLLAAQAGAGRVTCVERSGMLYRMAKQTLEANAGRLPAGVVHLLPRPLEVAGVLGEAPARPAGGAGEGEQGEGQEPGDQQAGSAARQASDGGPPADDAACQLPQRAEVLVTDLLDHSVLGMRLLPSIDYAAARLLAPGARIVPQAVQARRAASACCVG